MFKNGTPVTIGLVFCAVHPVTLVTEAESLAKLDWSKVKAGDVLAVNGVHVIAYLGDDQCMDSDPLHDGVGRGQRFNVDRKEK